jgi:hypothetical protein
MTKQKQNTEFFVRVIEAVKTPLGFFVLIVLVVSGIIASLSQGVDRTYLVGGMLALTFLLVLLVSVIAVFRPEALYGARPAVTDRPAPEDAGREPPELSPFESIADADTPVVVAVEPCVGSTVDPSTSAFRVTFSKPMRKGWSFTGVSEGSFPKIVGDPQLSNDRRTITAGVSLAPDCSYAFWLNSDRHRSFSGEDGRPAVPYFVYFRTGRENPYSAGA